MATTAKRITTIQNGAVAIPADLRERFGFEDGHIVALETTENGIVVRPFDALPEVEVYTPERIAEFLLNNVVDTEDYRRAVEEVRRMGFEPDQILHDPPSS